MHWPSATGVVIPCFNEAGRIAKVIADVRAYVPAVVVVDDGSTDGTRSEAASAGARVLVHERNRGKGAALTTGLQWLCDHAFAWALTLDGDGQHLAGDIPLFWDRAEATGASLVVGDRMPSADRIPFVRRHVNRWMSRQISRLAGEHFPDSQCGFRLIQLNAWAALDLERTRFEFESELLLAFSAGGYRIEFVPIQVVYGMQCSKIRPFIDSYRWFRWWWQACRTNRPAR